MLDRQLYDTLLTEQFSTHFDVSHTINIKTYRCNYKKYRQELCEMLIFNQRLHISGSVKWPLLYKHVVLDMALFSRENPIICFLQNYNPLKRYTAPFH